MKKLQLFAHSVFLSLLLLVALRWILFLNNNNNKIIFKTLIFTFRISLLWNLSFFIVHYFKIFRNWLLKLQISFFISFLDCFTTKVNCAFLIFINFYHFSLKLFFRFFLLKRKRSLSFFTQQRNKNLLTKLFLSLSFFRHGSNDMTLLKNIYMYAFMHFLTYLFYFLMLKKECKKLYFYFF